MHLLGCIGSSGSDLRASRADPSSGSRPTGAPPLRGTRRVDWIEEALAPVRPIVQRRAFARLVSAISICVGAAALIVLRDIRGLDQATAADVSVWSARALVRAALEEAETATGTKSRKR